jgi:amino acid transporter
VLNWFQIGGLAIATIGIVAVASDDNFRFSDFEETNLFRSAAFIQIVVGFMVALFAFLGCCGSIKESKALLYTVSV